MSRTNEKNGPRPSRPVPPEPADKVRGRLRDLVDALELVLRCRSSAAAEAAAFERIERDIHRLAEAVERTPRPRDGRALARPCGPDRRAGDARTRGTGVAEPADGLAAGSGGADEGPAAHPAEVAAEFADHQRRLRALGR
jgi:hypothetical protein